jgi:pyruvate kinase
MMLNQPLVTVEPRSAERTLASSHATATIPAAWHTPLPARTELTTELENTATTTTRLANHQPAPTAPPTLSRQTKIITTLSPATESGDVLLSLLEAGVCVFRVNLAGVSRESALKAVYAIRSISTERQRPVSLLLETQPFAGRAPDSPALTESDWADIRFGLECGVDWLAVPAGRDGAAVRQLREFLAEQKKNNVSILVRIENPSALVALDQIIQDADGIILGGVNPAGEYPEAEMRRDWRRIVQQCVRVRKLAVIAAGGNEGVASALAAQPDALLLAAETSVGSNPLQSVQTLDAVIRREETNDLHEAPATVALITEQDRTIAAAVQQANETKVAAIVVIARFGNSATLCAALRPRHARVLVFTPDARLARRLRLRYALEPIVLPFAAQPHATLAAAERVLRERKLVARSAKVVFITDQLEAGEHTSSVQVREIA